MKRKVFLQVYGTAARRCPYCGIELDAHDYVGFDPASGPEAGSVSVCAYCGGVALFTADGLRLPTDAEIDEIHKLEIWPVIEAFREKRG